MTQDTARMTDANERAMGSILLTGATGFLGTQLLHNLLARSDTSVTCLLRGEDEQRARDALIRKLRWYFPEAPWNESLQRLRVVLGDVSGDQLGMRGRVYEELAMTTRTIIHSAAKISHVGAPSAFFRANTESVAQLIAFARRGLPKQLHQISTLSVVGHFMEPTSLTEFSERHLEVGQSFAAAGPYAESKYQAEILMRQAFETGLRGAVYRVGYVGPHSVTGRFQQNIQENFIASYLRACVRVGVAPHLPDVPVRVTPVDSAARAIVTLITRAETTGKTFHIETPHALRQYDFVRVLQAAGYPVRLLPLEDFCDRAPRISQDAEAISILVPNEHAGRHVPFDSRMTLLELDRLGCDFPVPTSVWLGRFLQHAIEVGFLEAPRFWNLGRLPAGLL